MGKAVCTNVIECNPDGSATVIGATHIPIPHYWQAPYIDVVSPEPLPNFSTWHAGRYAVAKCVKFKRYAVEAFRLWRSRGYWNEPKTMTQLAIKAEGDLEPLGIKPVCILPYGFFDP